MPLLSEALDHFIEEKPEITQDFLSALFKSHHNLGNLSIEEDDVVLDFYICHTLYLITSICETVKTSYTNHYAAAAEISFSSNLENITVNKLRNYLYHEFLIPEDTQTKWEIIKNLIELIFELNLIFDQKSTHLQFSDNTFLKKLDALLKKHTLNHFEGQNIFLKARNIAELCSSFPSTIYPIAPFKVTKKNINEQHEKLNNLVFGENDGYFSILNKIEKENKYLEEPLDLNAFSTTLKKQTEKKLHEWAIEFFKEIDDFSKIPGKRTTAIQNVVNYLKFLLEKPISFEKLKFYEIAVFLSNSINKPTNGIKNFSAYFKKKILTELIKTMDSQKEVLFDILQNNKNEIDKPTMDYYIKNLKTLFVAVETVIQENIEEENVEIKRDHYYKNKLDKALRALYRHEPKEYDHFIYYLKQAIELQPSAYMPIFLKKCLEFIINFEDTDHPTFPNIVREHFLTEINHNYTKIIYFLKKFRKIKNHPAINDDTSLPFFGAEMYLITSMNASLKTIENIEHVSSDKKIQEQIKYIRLELNMRSHDEIKTLDPNQLNFFELISSYSGIGKSIANFRHYSLKLDERVKENIKILYAAFERGTPYQSPSDTETLNFTDLFKLQTGKVKLATGFNRAKKIMTLCFSTLLTSHLNTSIMEKEKIPETENTQLHPRII
jgi:hypothetical protein